jgi:hypothetical protein
VFAAEDKVIAPGECSLVSVYSDCTDGDLYYDGCTDRAHVRGVEGILPFDRGCGQILVSMAAFSRSPDVVTKGSFVGTLSTVIDLEVDDAEEENVSESWSLERIAENVSLSGLSDGEVTRVLGMLFDR